jgi:hypothetical protein
MPISFSSLDCPNCGAPIDWDGKYGRPMIDRRPLATE